MMEDLALAGYTKENLSGFDSESQLLICEIEEGKTK
jgi:hypothetical protein